MIVKAVWNFLFTAGLAGVSASASAAVAYFTFPMRDTRFSVESVIDRGLVKELTVVCGAHDGVVRHSPLDHVWCDEKDICHASLNEAIRGSCG